MKISNSKRSLFAALAIGFAALLLFAPAIGYDFVDLDDSNVFASPTIRSGLTPASIHWAVSSVYRCYWLPLTQLSFLLDASLHGLSPQGCHAVNILFHALNAALLYLALVMMTGNRRAGLIAALLFALHPLRVESVVWVTERKDVLSSFFWLLSTIAYIGFVRRRTAGRYALVFISMLLGLLAKPMLVTLPFTFLLLDYWPLRRELRWRSLLLEKIPLFILSAGFSWITYATQSACEAVIPVDRAPLLPRLGMSCLNYTQYLLKIIWPAELACIYPRVTADSFSPVLAAVGLIVLIGLTGATFKLRRRYPHLVVGWFWFIGTLVPVAGFIQVGAASFADRFTYIPAIGISIMAGWSVASLKSKNIVFRWAVAGMVAAVLVAMAVQTRRQMSYWKTSEALFRHTLSVTGPNALAHTYLGYTLMSKGQPEEALDHLAISTEVDPMFAPNYVYASQCLLDLGFVAEAAEYIRIAKRRMPGPLLEKVNPAYMNNLAIVLKRAGHKRAALEQFRTLLEWEPESVPTLNNLAWMLATDADAEIRNPEEALTHALRAAELSDGRDVMVLDTLAAAQAANGRFTDAIDTVAKAIRLAEKTEQTYFLTDLTEHLKEYERAEPHISSYTDAGETRPSTSIDVLPPSIRDALLHNRKENADEPFEKP